MSFLRYPKYRFSGVDWIGEVPEHWEAIRYKNIFREKQSTSGAYLPAGAISFGRVVFKDEETFNEATKATYQEVLSGEYLINPINLNYDLKSLRTALSEIDTCVSPAYIVLQPKVSLDHRYLTYQMYLFDIRHMKTLGAGVRQTITFGDIGGCLTQLPPVSEQTAIASFLDREISKIDALAVEQRRLIDLLKDKRHAVISLAVTKGLNTDAPMKASGIEWLGDVPSHWEVSRLKNVFCEVADAGTDELPILSVSIHHGVSDKEFNDEEMDRKVTRSDDRSKYKRVAPGDLVYNMMRAWQGGFGTVTIEGMVSPAYVVARPKTSITTAYVEHLLRTPQAIEQMRRHSRGITDFRLRLYWDEFKNIKIPLPPEQEAVEICLAIKSMDNSFNELTAEAERAIQLLQERRAALISAAVTGKIDVRDKRDK